MVENHLKQMILKTFEPKKADTIFTEEGDAPAWLTELIGQSLLTEIYDYYLLIFLYVRFNDVSLCLVRDWIVYWNCYE